MLDQACTRASDWNVLAGGGGSGCTAGVKLIVTPARLSQEQQLTDWVLLAPRAGLEPATIRLTEDWPGFSVVRDLMDLTRRPKSVLKSEVSIAVSTDGLAIGNGVHSG